VNANRQRRFRCGDVAADGRLGWALLDDVFIDI
jgi:hypothetical protein